MEWTKEQRYRRVEEAGEAEVRELASRVDACGWRQSYHIQPKTGLLNDPNGFSFYNGEYHLFYQWFPLGPVHGLKYWYHTKSKDLVHWEDQGVGIAPDRAYDSHGAYSGSAIEHDGKLHLLYTGNTRDEEWVRHPYQCLAVMDESGIRKHETAVIPTVPPGYTDHFRDPKVWREGEWFYMVIGAQRTDRTGCVVLYRSPDVVKWEFMGELHTELTRFGYMWECPDYFELDNEGVLIFSPQGLQPEGHLYQNIYQSGYIVGNKLNPVDLRLTHGAFQELDRGFDFYAPQTTVDGKGRRLLVGWMGLPEISYPTDASGWAHCLTLPRELSIRDGKLLQRPVPELQALRKQGDEAEDTLMDEMKSYAGFTGKAYELLCEWTNVDAAAFGIEFRAGGAEKTVIRYDAVRKELTLDRTASGAMFAAEYGTARTCQLDAARVKLHLFVDVSSVEIFVNDGEEVFTSRIFPDGESQGIRFFTEGGQASFTAEKWEY